MWVQMLLDFEYCVAASEVPSQAMEPLHGSVVLWAFGCSAREPRASRAAEGLMQALREEAAAAA